MQDLLGLGGEKKLRALSGLAGGIGHQGATCGILMGGALVLGLAGADAGWDQDEIAARSCAKLREFVRRFEKQAGGRLCREIIRTDFNDVLQLRKYILTRSLGCVRLVGRSATILADIVADESQMPDERYHELNRRFSEREFHCAHHVLVRASEQLGIEPALPPHVLIPLNGGTAYSGSTCAALVGGCIVIGGQTGGDIRENSVFKTLRRMALTFMQGGAAFNRLDLSPANDALLRCAELFKWFEGAFHSHLCREITGIDFADENQVRDYFERDTVSRCVSMAEETAVKAAKLAE